MLSLYALGADEVKFKLPRLREKLLSSVRTTQQFGKATLTFSTLELGHQATYTCHALSTRRGLRKSRGFQLVVLRREEKDKSLEGVEEGGRVVEGKVENEEEERDGVREGEEREGEEMEGVREGEGEEREGDEVEGVRVEGEERDEGEREGGEVMEERGKGREELEERGKGREELEEEAIDAAGAGPVFETMEDRAKVGNSTPIHPHPDV